MKTHRYREKRRAKIRLKMQRSLEGRYGNDELSQSLVTVAFAILLLSLIKPLRFIYIVSILIMVWTLIRCYSKNMEKRYAERERYLRFKDGWEDEVAFRHNQWTDRKVYRYFKCKQCKTILRVSKGKGKIKVSCPKCHAKIIRKT